MVFVSTVFNVYVNFLVPLRTAIIIKRGRGGGAFKRSSSRQKLLILCQTVTALETFVSIPVSTFDFLPVLFMNLLSSYLH